LNVLTYVIHALVLGQPLLFWYIYERYAKLGCYPEVDAFIEYIFIVVGLLCAGLVILLKARFEFYSTNLLVQYIFLVLYAYGKVNNRINSLKAISLSFLLVFFNSYLWESVLHFAEYTINPMRIFNFRELIHLIVLPFLYYHYNYDRKPIMNKLKVTLFINFLFSIFYLEVFPRTPLIWSISIPIFKTIPLVFTFFNRWFSLIMLLDIFNSNMSEKKEDERKRLF